MKVMNMSRAFWSCVLLYCAYLMAKITVPYYFAAWMHDFLVTKMQIIHLFHYRTAFLVHISSSLVVIFAGACLFLSSSDLRYWKIHRWLGRLYVGAVLLLAAPSGLIMAYHANGGLLAQVNFTLLSVLWWLFTFFGFSTIIKGDVAKHKHWMLRSYALTLSAVTLRFLQMVIPTAWVDAPVFTYILVSWCSWLFNLVIVEIYIYSVSSRVDSPLIVSQ